MGDVVEFVNRATANEVDEWIARLCQELKDRVAANDARDRAMFWHAMEPINDGQGRTLPDVVMNDDQVRKVPDIGFCIQLSYAIAALEMIGTNLFNGGQSEDEPCFAQHFAARNLAIIALMQCKPRAWADRTPEPTA